MIFKNIKELEKYAGRRWEGKQIALPKDIYMQIFCEGYVDALNNIVNGDLLAAQEMIDRAKDRAIPGTEAEKNFNEFINMCPYCSKPINQHDESCPTNVLEL
jgi:hypothetical protein